MEIEILVEKNAVSRAKSFWLTGKFEFPSMTCVETKEIKLMKSSFDFFTKTSKGVSDR